MAKGYQSLITLYENNGWFEAGTSNPFVPVLESEGLKINLMKPERNSLVRDTRAHLPDSLIYDSEYKPEGSIEIIPKLEDLSTILMSHFQMVTEVETGSSFLNTYVPLKNPPTWSGDNLYGTGTYGATTDAVYSIDIKRKVGDTDFTSNTHHFKRGVCDKLTFKQETGEDLKVKADYKFKGFELGDTSGEFGGTDVGSYSSGTFVDWSHGTWDITLNGDGAPVTLDELSGITIECSNNLTEKKSPGSLERQVFNFGNYTVKGEFTFDHGYFGDTDYYFITPFQTDVSHTIVGTIWHSDTEYMTIDMPHVRLKPYEMGMGKPDDFLDARVNFEAYESDGTSPITVTLHVADSSPTLSATYWDAAFGARTIGLYDLADAGSTSRTLSEYDFADRDA